MPSSQKNKQNLKTFVSSCLSGICKAQKYKAYILKYKALILKYVPCIFYDKPCVFSRFRKQGFRTAKRVFLFEMKLRKNGTLAFWHAANGRIVYKSLNLQQNSYENKTIS